MDTQGVVAKQDSFAEDNRGITGSTLKIIAIVIMLIDHVGAVILERFPIVGTPLYTVDRILRSVGRLAFPIFCFLLVEGFIYTRDRAKYAVRLFVFALISEIPFDIAVTGRIFNLTYQNVFFTLLAGFLTICVLDEVKQREFNFSSPKAEMVLRLVLTVLITAAGMVAAYLLKTDYSFAGVLAIVVMYGIKERKPEAMFGGCAVLTAYKFSEAFAFLDIFLIKMYNGKRGLKLKYIFYVFYPVHLLVLYCIARLLGATM
ncbi:MAG: conjugal transfer protein TraX [Lachnospiraceae bacterium]|nr:conjugal transfer protein TraX [Lachnospiraceae bacterium]